MFSVLFTSDAMNSSIKQNKWLMNVHNNKRVQNKYRQQKKVTNKCGTNEQWQMKQSTLKKKKNSDPK